MDRLGYSFVIFQTGEGSEDNPNSSSINISTALDQILSIQNNGAGPANAPNFPQQPAPGAFRPNTAATNTPNGGESGTQLDANSAISLLDITYVFSNDPTDTNNATNQPRSAAATGAPVAPGAPGANMGTTGGPNNSASNIATGTGTSGLPFNITNANTNNNAGQQGHNSSLFELPNLHGANGNRDLSSMIEFAATLAMEALTNHSRRNNGIKKETFEGFPIRSKEQLTEKNCPICFDEYEDDIKEDSVINDAKRKRNTGEGEEEEEKESNESTSKRTKNTPASSSAEISSSASNEDLLNAFRATQLPDIIDTTTEASSSSSSAAAPSSTPEATRTSTNAGPAAATQEQQSETVAYTHIPIELPCHHTFGRSCLYEWLKSNNSCPLCRETVHPDHSATESRSTRTTNNRHNPIIIIVNRNQNSNGNGNTAATPANTTANNNNNNNSSNDSSSNTPGANVTSGAGTSNTAQPNTQRDNSPFTQLYLDALFGQQQTNAAQPSTTSRNPFTANILRNLGSAGNTDSIFSSGVASRRTANGVETFNLNGGPTPANPITTSSTDTNPTTATSTSTSNITSNNATNANATNGNVTNNFFQESSRLLQQRISNNRFISEVLGLNDNPTSTSSNFQNFVTQRFQEQLRRETEEPSRSANSSSSQNAGDGSSSSNNATSESNSSNNATLESDSSNTATSTGNRDVSNDRNENNDEESSNRDANNES